MSELKTQFTRGVMWNSLSTAGGIGVQLIGGIVLGLWVEKPEMRVVGLVLAIVNLPYFLSEMGLTIALVQAPEIRPVHLNSIFVINLLVGILLALYCVAIGPAAAWFFDAPVLRPVLTMMSLIFVVLAFGLVQRALLVRALDFGSVSRAEFAGYVAYVAFLTYFAWKGRGVWALAAGKLAQQIVETGGLCLSARYVPNVRDVNFREVRPMILFGLNTTASRIVNYFVNNLDMLLVGRFLPKATGGDYSFARQMVIAPSLRLVQLVTRVGMPVLARMQEEKPRMARTLCQFDKLQALIIFPAFLGFLCVAPEALRVVFGAKWDPAVPLIRILCLGVCLHSLIGVSSTIFYALARADLALRLQLYLLAVRPLALLVALVVFHSIELVCWVMFLDRIYFVYLYEKKAFDLIDGRWTDTLKHLVSPTAASALMMVAVFVAKFALAGFATTRSAQASVLAIEVVVGAGVFVATLLLTDRSIVREFRSLIAGGEKTA